jgi:hypothetical protein
MARMASNMSDYAIAKQREVGVQKELAQAVSGSQATDAKSVTLAQSRLLYLTTLGTTDGTITQS